MFLTFDTYILWFISFFLSLQFKRVEETNGPFISNGERAFFFAFLCGYVKKCKEIPSVSDYLTTFASDTEWTVS